MTLFLVARARRRSLVEDVLLDGLEPLRAHRDRRLRRLRRFVLPGDGKPHVGADPFYPDLH